MLNIKYRPLGSYVLVTAPNLQEKTDSGIIKSPEMIASEKASWDGSVTVIKAGPKCQWLKEGMKAFIAPGSPSYPMAIDGVEYMQLDEFSILGYNED